MSVEIFGCSSNHINFEVDGKEYVLTLHEVKEGEHWSEYAHKVKRGHWEWQGDSFFKCDVCGKSTRMCFDFSGKYYTTPYCPYCGARNDGDNNA